VPDVSLFQFTLICYSVFLFAYVFHAAGDRWIWGVVGTDLFFSRDERSIRFHNAASDERR
jgi:hypothetical protein